MPGSLLGIIIATIVAVVTGWQVANIGVIPRTILLDDRLTLNSIPWDQMNSLLAPALSIAASTWSWLTFSQKIRLCGARQTLTLKAESTTPGTYASPMPIDRAGLWHVEVTARRAGEVFVCERDVMVVPPPALSGQ